MKKIMIIGCGGAGKSTLARQLGEKLNLPVVHLDKLFWRPGWEHISRAEFDRLHGEALSGESWIIDGNYDRTMAERAKYCDTIIYLDFSRFACLLGVAKRILTTYGTVRPDMGDGCAERFDPEFVKWVWDFNKNNREKNYRLLNETEGVETIVLKNRRAVKKFLKQMETVN
ncbi:MAG: DNA topology modulation protein [Clostridia bacterium]|nr:DNA topology modulation protein [Clostridia bacterium]